MLVTLLTCAFNADIKKKNNFVNFYYLTIFVFNNVAQKLGAQTLVLFFFPVNFKPSFARVFTTKKSKNCHYHHHRHRHHHHHHTLLMTKKYAYAKEMYMYFKLQVSLIRVIVLHGTECITNAHFIVLLQSNRQLLK